MDTQTETTETESEVVPEEEAREVPVEELTPVERPTAEPRQSRQERKAKRLDVESAQRERDEIKARFETEAQERQRLATELAEIRGRLQERQQQTQQIDKNEQTKSKVAELRKQAKFHLFLSAKAQDQATADKEWDEHKRLEDEANDLRDEMRDAERWEKRRGEITQSLPNGSAQAERARIDAKFPWLEASEEAQALADARMKALLKSGRPGSRETAYEAIAWAGQKLGLGGGGGSPTNGQRQLYSGIPSGEGPGGGGDNRKTIKMGRHEEALARAAYSHLEAKDAYKQWAKDMSARMSDNDE
jgi:hypothetical protein